jgi:hypothetical protein
MVDGPTDPTWPRRSAERGQVTRAHHVDGGGLDVPGAACDLPLEPAAAGDGPRGFSKEKAMKQLLIGLAALGAVAVMAGGAAAQAAAPPASNLPTAVGPSFVDANGDGVCDNCTGTPRGQGQNARQGKGGGSGPGNGTGNQGVGPRDGSGYGAGSGRGTCNGTGPRGSGRGRRR